MIYINFYSSFISIFSDAGNRCAIFVASCVLLKSLIMTNKFDVVQSVLLLRRCRSNLVNTIVSFNLLLKLIIMLFSLLKRILSNFYMIFAVNILNTN